VKKQKQVLMLAKVSAEKRSSDDDYAIEKSKKQKQKKWNI